MKAKLVVTIALLLIPLAISERQEHKEKESASFNQPQRTIYLGTHMLRETDFKHYNLYPA